MGLVLLKLVHQTLLIPQGGLSHGEEWMGGDGKELVGVGWGGGRRRGRRNGLMSKMKSKSLNKI